MEIGIYCSVCSSRTAVSVAAPEGWTIRGDAFDNEEDGFCPKHKSVVDFVEAQCPGCVSSWGEMCPLKEAFGSSSAEERDFTDTDVSALQRGVCPRRVGGTLMVSGGKIEEIDIRTGPEAAGGMALAEEFLSDHAKYPPQFR